MNIDFIDILKAAGILLGAYLALYFIVRCARGMSILRSTIPTPGKKIVADHFYFLPCYRLTVIAKARVLVKLKDGKIDGDPALIDLSISPETTIEADTDQLIALNYMGDMFSNDEIRVSVSPESLLENVYTSTEDRIDEIITTVAAAPKEMISTLETMEFVRTEEITYEIKEFIKVFEIGATEIANDGKIKRSWIIAIEKNELRVSFVLFNTNFLPKYKFNEEDHESDGLLTRPLKQQNWELIVEGVEGKVKAFTCMVPDQSRLICVPVRRAWFVKKLQLPKLSKGMLVENYIVKPSEAEAFASIPIAIGKALISIPAQLLRFRIIHDKLETEKENAQIELLKARKAKADLEIKELADQLTTLKEKLKRYAGDVEPAQDGGMQGGGPKLGKAPATGPDQTQSLAEIIKRGRSNFIKKDNSGEEVMEAAVIIEPHSWDKNFNGTWPHYDNKKINNCVPASAAHMIICWTSNKKPVNVLEEKDVIAAYKTSTACNAGGCTITTFLGQWLTSKFCGTVILGAGKLKTREPDDLKLAILHFGACMVGLQMPKMAQNQVAGQWFIDTTASEADRARGSWAENAGHAVCAVGFNDLGVKIISWGEPILMTWQFYEAYNDETFVVLSNDWLKEGETVPAPSNKTFNELVSIIIELQKNLKPSA